LVTIWTKFRIYEDAVSICARKLLQRQSDQVAKSALWHGVTALCDVRSKPYSRMNPQFNKEELKQALLKAAISYVFLGKELGARTEDPSCYDGGRVQYDRLAQTEVFRKGRDRIE
jgi:hypothetical protein